MDKAFFEQLVEVAQLAALVLMGDFSFPDMCWKYNTAQRNQSKRFLECVEKLPYAAGRRSYQG